MCRAHGLANYSEETGLGMKEAKRMSDPKNEARSHAAFHKGTCFEFAGSAGEVDSCECTANAIYEVSSALLERTGLFGKNSRVLWHE